MSRSRSDRRWSLIWLQTLLGATVLGIWLIVGVYILDDELITAVVKILPLALAYLAGILSRYFPGLQEAGKSTSDWINARRRT